MEMLFGYLKIRFVCVFLVFLALFSFVVSAESNVMVVEAEDSSIVSLNGDWKTISSEDGLISIVASRSGSELVMDFFGTELYLNARTGGEGAVLGVQVDGGAIESVKVMSRGYRQVRVVGGLENARHSLRLTLQSGMLAVDKIIMGSPTEIPVLKPRVSEDYYTRASYNRPWIFRDFNGTYWMTMEVQSLSQYGDIYITSSRDGVSWSRPKPVVKSVYHDYDSATVLDSKGEFWMVFTRIEPVNNRTRNIPYYTHSTDGINWDEPKRIDVPQDNAYYPYLYYDTDKNLFIYLYASGSVEDGEYHDNIYIAVSKSLENLGEPLKITDNSMKSSYYPTLIKDDSGEYWIYFVSPKLEDERIFANHNDIFVMHSPDLRHWSTPLLVTDGNKSVTYNYLHPAYKDGVYYLALTSSQRLTEDAYIMQSRDGLKFTPPARVIDRKGRNIIDYKSMMVDQDGVLWMAYAYVLDDGNRAIFIINSSDGSVWSKPVRVTPPSNIFGELWLDSEPKPESVRRLEAKVESGTEQELEGFKEKNSRPEDMRAEEDNIPQSGFDTGWIVVISILFLAGVKKIKK